MPIEDFIIQVYCEAARIKVVVASVMLSTVE